MTKLGMKAWTIGATITKLAGCGKMGPLERPGPLNRLARKAIEPV